MLSVLPQSFWNERTICFPETNCTFFTAKEHFFSIQVTEVKFLVLPLTNKLHTSSMATIWLGFLAQTKQTNLSECGSTSSADFVSSAKVEIVRVQYTSRKANAFTHHIVLIQPVEIPKKVNVKQSLKFMRHCTFYNTYANGEDKLFSIGRLTCENSCTRFWKVVGISKF